MSSEVVQKEQPEEKYQIRPSYKNSLNPRVVKDLISAVLVSSLQGKEYDQNETGGWTKEIATAIKAKLKELKLPRYKFLVQVIIAMFCVAVAFGVYLY